MLKDKLDDEEVDLGWIYPVSLFAEGHRVGWWGFICCLLFISNVCPHKRDVTEIYNKAFAPPWTSSQIVPHIKFFLILILKHVH